MWAAIRSPWSALQSLAARLADLADPGKEALRRLHDALGSQAPVSVRENATVLPEGSTPRWSRKPVLFDFGDDIIAAAKGDELPRALIAKGMVPGCSPVGWCSFGGDEFAQTVPAGWVLGAFRSLPATLPTSLRREADAETRPVGKKLKALPRAKQLSWINAMRAAALSCKGDAFDA
ncbi:hypothetical protein [Streptomyces sp. NPDC101165]|uniref:hypothetical protein n=1 Tax=Streptomyces sp. NPDC101165 TaxID=3366119 RepID=UPI00382F460C